MHSPLGNVLILLSFFSFLLVKLVAVDINPLSFLRDMALDEAVFVCAFKKNFCVAAYAGALQFGEVQNRDRLFFKDQEWICVPQKKLPEFLKILEALGKNIALEDAEKRFEHMSFQLSKNEVLVLQNCQIEVNRRNMPPGEKAKFILEYDEFMYIDFLSALSNVLLFITMPTREQFMVMKKYSELHLENNSTETKIVLVAKAIAENSPHKQFMLEQFLSMNMPVIEIYVKILRILGEK